MGRAPCCEKMGLNKGTWTPEEDKILISFIQKNGHGNWRSLPKQAGLLRCGKSCRLRWINYLRPDIKRGNFTKEDEETIIKLHEILGNRWAAIAARLPGRTDNEIKNVWHTHLKKKIKNHQTCQQITNITREDWAAKANSDDMNSSPFSPQHSSGELSSVTADSLEQFGKTDERSWVGEIGNDEEVKIENMQVAKEEVQFQFPLFPMDADGEDVNADPSRFEGGCDFWYGLVSRNVDLPDLPDF